MSEAEAETGEKTFMLPTIDGSNKVPVNENQLVQLAQQLCSLETSYFLIKNH